MALRSASRGRGSVLRSVLSSSFSFIHSRATSFGFKEVSEEEKGELVGNVFTSFASNYDLMNDIMSGGLHRLWKDRLIFKLNPFPGVKQLDVAGGTGDVAFRLLDAGNSIAHRAELDVSADETLGETEVYVCDISQQG